MRSEGQRLHPDPRIRWISDQLPELSVLAPLAISFDLVMMTAVWQHVPPSQRDRAFRKVAPLVRSGGLLAISLRSGPSPAGSGMHPVSLKQVERLSRNHGFAVEKVQQAPDQQGRAEVSWTCVALRLPDDGTGALPLLRHVILNDQKSATYSSVYSAPFVGPQMGRPEWFKTRITRKAAGTCSPSSACRIPNKSFSRPS
jgi:hypothetical protein